MPIYEYKCNDCGLVFEARQKFSDAPLKECRECNGAVNKMISNTAFTLKGGAGTSKVTPRHHLPALKQILEHVPKLRDEPSIPIGSRSGSYVYKVQQ